jgi:hypothetical protein
VTVDRRPVAEIVPMRRRRKVPASEALNIAARHASDPRLLDDESTSDPLPVDAEMARQFAFIAAELRGRLAECRSSTPSWRPLPRQSRYLSSLKIGTTTRFRGSKSFEYDRRCRTTDPPEAGTAVPEPSFRGEAPRGGVRARYLAVDGPRCLVSPTLSDTHIGALCPRRSRGAVDPGAASCLGTSAGRGRSSASSWYRCVRISPAVGLRNPQRLAGTGRRHPGDGRHR